MRFASSFSLVVLQVLENLDEKGWPKEEIRNTLMPIARLPGEWINSTGPHTSNRNLPELIIDRIPLPRVRTQTCLTRSPLYNSRLTAVSWEIRFAATLDNF